MSCQFVWSVKCVHPPWMNVVNGPEFMFWMVWSWMKGAVLNGPECMSWMVHHEWRGPDCPCTPPLSPESPNPPAETPSSVRTTSPRSRRSGELWLPDHHLIIFNNYIQLFSICGQNYKIRWVHYMYIFFLFHILIFIWLTFFQFVVRTKKAGEFIE